MTHEELLEKLRAKHAALMAVALKATTPGQRGAITRQKKELRVACSQLASPKMHRGARRS